MTLAANYNATFTVTRKTRSGTEDGTPIYTESSVVISGWFDEIHARGYDEPTRDESIAYMDRRAVFFCNADADIQQDDVGTVSISGLDRGSWMVSILRTAPTPSGAHHLEVQLQGTKESV